MQRYFQIRTKMAQNCQKIYIWLPNEKYIVQSVILWIRCIVALLCTTAGMWSHKVVPSPFSSWPSKKQWHACGIFKGQPLLWWAVSCGNKECRSLSNRKTSSSVNSQENELAKHFRWWSVLGRSLGSQWHRREWATIETELKIQEVATFVRAPTITAAGISPATCHRILSGDLNMSQCSTCPDPRPTWWSHEHWRWPDWWQCWWRWDVSQPDHNNRHGSWCCHVVRN